MGWFYLAGFGLVAAFGLVTAAGFLFFTEPEALGKLGMFLFYSSLFFGLSSFFVLTSLIIKKFFGQENFKEYFRTALRRSAMLAFVLIASLAMQSLKILTLPIMAGLIISLIFLELYLLTRV